MQPKTKLFISDAQLDEVAKLFSILAEASRLRLLKALMAGPMTVTELVEATGMKQGNVSKHLGVLHGVRFVAREKAGNFARYSIADPRLHTLCQLMCERVEEDARATLEKLSGAPQRR
ncbi:MAG TPA: metalloregulator ArsR/SmtB family transcription factor [Chthoniobacteraceae bacterium]|nr:metalloregulator ArsR/SmtB family transcription factor [Chthoniobacteraceae bacterium]